MLPINVMCRRVLYKAAETYVYRVTAGVCSIHTHHTELHATLKKPRHNICSGYDVQTFRKQWVPSENNCVRIDQKKALFFDFSDKIKILSKPRLIAIIYLHFYQKKLTFILIKHRLRGQFIFGRSGVACTYT